MGIKKINLRNNTKTEKMFAGYFVVLTKKQKIALEYKHASW